MIGFRGQLLHEPRSLSKPLRSAQSSLQSYILRDIVPAPSLEDGTFVYEDLDRISESHSQPLHSDMLDAFLSDLDLSDEALWTLTRWDHTQTYPDPTFNCKAIVTLQKEGLNIYRVRPLKGQLRRYRIIYAFDATKNCYWILAVVVKRPEVVEDDDLKEYYNYELDHRITIRVREEYVRRNIPKIVYG